MPDDNVRETTTEFPVAATPVVTWPGQEIHVWSMPLDLPDHRWQPWRDLLNTEEIQRADKFYFDRDRRRFTVRRALMRRTLAAYLNVGPEKVVFGYGDRGKPRVAWPTGERADTLEFNLSDSHEMAILALTQDRPLGADIEHLRPMPQWEQIAARYFSAWEKQALVELPAEQQARGFFNAWTRKEALLKAVGTGLAVPLAQAEVEVRPGAEPVVLAFPGDPERRPSWWLTAWDVGTEYIAALASPGSPAILRHFSWDV